ncbi:hypothetical protein NUSPORA_02132 [Nucleospora cyclopteri]
MIKKIANLFSLLFYIQKIKTAFCLIDTINLIISDDPFLESFCPKLYYFRTHFKLENIMMHYRKIIDMPTREKFNLQCR